MSSNGASDLPWLYKVSVAAVVGLTTGSILVALIRSCVRSLKAQQELDGGGGGGGGDTAAAAAAVEIVARRRPDDGPLVCTYRRADGWREATCGVCLSELADGEAVRVLPACLHYFHDACVGEWMRARATCPLCRTPAGAATPG